MGRNMIHPTVASPFNSALAGRMRSDLAQMESALNDWENGNDHVVDVLRRCASRINSGIYNFAIDPTGNTQKRNNIKRMVTEAVTATFAASGQEATADQIEQVISLVLNKKGL